MLAAPGLPSLARADRPADAEKAVAPGAYRGRPLAEVLRELERQGLRIVFTDALVPPDLRVLDEPRATDPRALLEEILAPHGLWAEERSPGVLVIVGGAAADGGAPKGAARSAADPALAAGPDMTLRDEIVVRPSQVSLLMEQAGGGFGFDRAQIERLPHLGGDLFRATSLLPGIAANDVSAQPSVHGGRRDELKVVLDGQELVGAYHLQDYDNALSIVPASVLASATLTTGSFSVPHGDRMSGVLDLRTRDAPAAGRRIVLGLSVLDLFASVAGRFAARGSWLLAGRRGALDLAERALGRGQPHFSDALGKLELDGRLGVLRAHALAARDTLSSERTAPDLEVLHSNRRSFDGWLTHSALLGGRLLLETTASSTSAQASRRGAASDEEVDLLLADRRERRVDNLDESLTLDLGPRQVLGLGIEARRTKAFFDYARASEQKLILLAPFAPLPVGSYAFDGTLRGDHFGVWASDRVSLWSGRLTAELGLRRDSYSATDEALWSPRLNLGLRLGERTVLRAGWGRFVQSQRPYEASIDDGDSVLHPAEQSEHRLLGVEVAAPGGPGHAGLGALRIELYDRSVARPRPRYESLLEPVGFFPEAENDRFRIAAERSGARGMEALLRGSGGPRLDWWISYAYSETWDVFHSKKVRRSLDQPHALAIDLNFQLPASWNLNLAWRWHSGWPTTPLARVQPVIEPAEDEEEPEVVLLGPLNSDRLPVYHRLDLRASRTWRVRSGHLTFFVDVQNVYDRRNLAGVNVNLDAAGRPQLEPQHWPGVFPSLGISWER